MTTNVEQLVSYLKAIDAHDLDSVRNAYADDVAFRVPGTELDSRCWRPRCLHMVRQRSVSTQRHE